MAIFGTSGSLRAALLAAACALALAPGCGGDSSSSDVSNEERYVSDSDLRRHRDGSPERTVLEWWRAAQFGNVVVARNLYAPGVAPPRLDLQRELSAANSQFVGEPQFNSADVSGDRATVFFFLSRPGADAPPRALSANLVKAGGQWRLADNVLLEQQVARVAKLLRERDEAD